LVGDALVVTESPSGRHQSVPMTRLEITPEGVITIDKVVIPNDSADALDMARAFFLVRGDVERALTAMFGFVGGIYDSVDRFQRHQRFICAVSFAGVGHRSLVDKLENRSSYSMASNIEGPVVLEKPRVLARAAFSDSSAEVTRALTLLQRRINAS